MDETQFRESFLWHVHSYVNEYIRFADTKASLVIGWTSALIGVLTASNFHKRFEWSPPGIICVAGFLGLIAAFVCAFIAIWPRLRTSQSKGFIFWKSILANGNREIFVAAFNQETAGALLEGVSQHLHDLSGVCSKKFCWVSYSIVFAFIGSILCGTMYLWFPAAIGK